MDETQQTVTGQTVQEPVVNPATAPVSDAEAQRKTAVTIQIFYAFCYYIVGIALAVWGFVIFYKYSQSYSQVVGTTPDKPIPAPWPNDHDLNGNVVANSYLAMGIVGVILTIWGVISTALAAAFQIKNRTFHHISNKLGWLSWITLNPASYGLIKHSNGYLSKKEKKKLAAKQAAANSDDSIDTSAQKN